MPSPSPHNDTIDDWDEWERDCRDAEEEYNRELHDWFDGDLPQDRHRDYYTERY